MISIIIPTRNEALNIVRCLTSIKTNGYTDYEIIVVDQESTDDTVALAKKYNAKVITVAKTDKYLPPSHSRNIGFTKSRGDVIYHLDADMEMEPGLLQEAINIFKDSKVAAIVVPERDIPGNFWARGKAFERSLYINTPMEAARISRRSVFATTKYDDQITSGEDWYIHQQFTKQGSIARTKKGVRHHIGVLSLGRELRKKSHYGRGSDQFLATNGGEMVKRFFELGWLYAKGIVKNIFTDPLSIGAFLVVRIVDSIALIMGMLTK